jgi:hypothetical protein
MRILTAILLTAGFLVTSTVPQTAGASPVGQAAPPPTEGPLAASSWSPTTKDDFMCTVTEAGDRRADALPTRTLSVARVGVKPPAVLFRFDTADTLVGMMPLGEVESRLLTVWMGATGYHIRVFAYTGAKVRQVLDTASRAFPEFVFDAFSHETILVTELTLENGEWTATRGMTQVHKWTGREYELLGRVPWARRFECQSRESCAALGKSRDEDWPEREAVRVSRF